MQKRSEQTFERRLQKEERRLQNNNRRQVQRIERKFLKTSERRLQNSLRSTIWNIGRWFRRTLREWENLGSSISLESLAAMRIFSGLFTLIFLLPDPSVYQVLPTLPDAMFRPPPGPASFLSGFPTRDVLLVLDGATRIFLILMTIGLATHFSSLASGITLMTLKGVLFSVGKVNHEIVPVLVPFLMAFSGWGRAWSMDALIWRPRIHATHSLVSSVWPLPLLALSIGFMMFTAGLPKAIGGWFDLDTQAALGHVINQHVTKGRQAVLLPLAYSTFNSPIWEILDGATVILELGFLVSLLRPLWFKAFLVGAVWFHIGVHSLMQIPFTANLLGYALFMNWGIIIKPIQRWRVRNLASLRFPKAYKAYAAAFLLLAASGMWFMSYSLFWPAPNVPAFWPAQTNPLFWTKDWFLLISAGGLTFWATWSGRRWSGKC